MRRQTLKIMNFLLQKTSLWDQLHWNLGLGNALLWFSRSVILKPLWPIDASISEIDICLSVWNSSEAGFLKIITVIYGLWIFLAPNFDVSNIIKIEYSWEISILFFYMSIYKVHFVDIFPLVITFLAKLAAVLHLFLVLYLDVSTWPLPLIISPYVSFLIEGLHQICFAYIF